MAERTPIKAIKRRSDMTEEERIAWRQRAASLMDLADDDDDLIESNELKYTEETFPLVELD